MRVLSLADLEVMSAFSDQLGEVFYAVDFNWRILAVNDLAVRFSGIAREDLIGRVYWEAVPRQEGSANDALLREAMAARTRTVLEAESPVRPGHIISGVAIPLTEGTAFVFRDVTAERQASRERERALRESEARFRHMADSAPAFIWMTDRRGRLVFANLHFEHVFGRPVAEMQIHGWTQFVLPEDLTPYRERFLEALAAWEHFSGVIRVRDRHGEVRWVRCDSVPRLDDEGSFLGYTGCGLDITEQRISEQALRASEGRLKAVQEHAGVGIAEADRDGRFLQVNEAFCRITGYSREELIGSVGWGLTHEGSLESERRTYTDQVAGCIDTYTIEKQFYRKSGEAAWGWLTSTAIRGEGGAYVSTVRTLLDITEDKRAEERQQLLIHELNHRVKNTLATVQSIIVQTLRSAPDLARARKDIEARLLSLARAHDLLTRESWQSADLREVVNEAVAAFGLRIGARVHVEGPSIQLHPRAALALALALHELGTNALKYGALSVETGTIDIAWTARQEEKSIALSIRWEERGGPPVAAPVRQGFGSRLIQRSLAQDLGGEVILRFEPTGLVCTVDVAIDPLPPRSATAP